MYSCMIFCDASRDIVTGVSAWAAWIKAGDRPALLYAAPFRDCMTCPNEAELRAIANAVALAKNNGYLVPGKVMVQSDSLIALGLILAFVPGATQSPAIDGLKADKPRKRRFLERFEDTGRAIATIARAADIQIVVRHVRGHQTGGGPNWLNRQVDKHAKAKMQEHRKATS